MTPSNQTVENTIIANGTEISVISSPNGEDYISLTDIARHRNPEFPADVIKNWLRLRSTIEYLGVWEEINNPNFKLVEFDQFKNAAGSNTFVMSPTKWIRETRAVGIRTKSGRYGGGTYAHSDIAFEFASWVSPEFKLYVIRDYQRLKQDESYRLTLDWNVKRLLSKANYRIHTDAIKDNLLPPDLTKQQEGFIYADEADVLNVALFGITAAQWRKENPGKKGNMRDYATIEQLLVLTNLESLNAHLIGNGIPQNERLHTLHETAVQQLISLTKSKSVEILNDLHNNPKLPT